MTGGEHRADGRKPAGKPAHPRVSLRRPSRSINRFYSRFVVFLKMALPMAALALLALVAAWPTLTAPPRATYKADEGQSEALNPRFYNFDEKNQPYSLTAEQAAQSPEHPGLISLTKPEAEMTDASGAWVTLNSDIGWYDRESKMLRLLGSVHVLRDDGSEFTTDEAFSDVRKGTSWGNGRVIGQGPQGEIDAVGFRMTERGKNVVFLNQSKANVQRMQPSGTPAPGHPSPSSAPAPQPPAVAEKPPAAIENTQPVQPAATGAVLPKQKPTRTGGNRVNVLEDSFAPAARTPAPIIPPVKPPIPAAKGDRT